VPDVSPRRLVWWLVRAYPPRFRQDVGLGLVDAIQDRMDARRAEGVSAAGVWAPAILDTLRNAPAEWMRAALELRGSRSRHRGGAEGPPHDGA